MLPISGSYSEDIDKMEQRIILTEKYLKNMVSLWFPIFTIVAPVLRLPVTLL